MIIWNNLIFPTSKGCPRQSRLNSFDKGSFMIWKRIRLVKRFDQKWFELSLFYVEVTLTIKCYLFIMQYLTIFIYRSFLPYLTISMWQKYLCTIQNALLAHSFKPDVFLNYSRIIHIIKDIYNVFCQEIDIVFKAAKVNRQDELATGL